MRGSEARAKGRRPERRVAVSGRQTALLRIRPTSASVSCHGLSPSSSGPLRTGALKVNWSSER